MHLAPQVVAAAKGVGGHQCFLDDIFDGSDGSESEVLMEDIPV